MGASTPPPHVARVGARAGVGGGGDGDGDGDNDCGNGGIIIPIPTPTPKHPAPFPLPSVAPTGVFKQGGDSSTEACKAQFCVIDGQTIPITWRNADTTKSTIAWSLANIAPGFQVSGFLPATTVQPHESRQTVTAQPKMLKSGVYTESVTNAFSDGKSTTGSANIQVLCSVHLQHTCPRIDSMYFVDSVQVSKYTDHQSGRMRHPVPIVAGRDAAVRVFVRGAYANQKPPIVRVKVSSSTGKQHFDISPSGMAGLPTTIDKDVEARAWQSYNYLIPGKLVQPGMQAVAVILNGNHAETIVRWPKSHTLHVAARSVPPLTITILPIIVDVTSKPSGHGKLIAEYTGNTGVADPTLVPSPLPTSASPTPTGHAVCGPMMVDLSNVSAKVRLPSADRPDSSIPLVFVIRCCSS